VTILPDGASVKPLEVLVPGEYYRLIVDPGVTDSSGAAVTPTTGTYRAPTFAESTAAAVHRKGIWAVRKPMHAHGGTALVTTARYRPTLTMRFRSSTVTVGFCRGPSNGYMAVYVDGSLKKNLTTYNAFTKCGATVTVKGLDGNRQHTVAVVETHRAGLRKGTQVTVDYFSVT
jgi:hypothetical protein